MSHNDYGTPTLTHSEMEDRAQKFFEDSPIVKLMEEPKSETPAETAGLKTGVPKGMGGAPTRASTFPESAVERKQYPVASGVLDYFPDALIAISQVSWLGNNQHNPGKPLHWDRAKSGDEGDALIRHFLQRGSVDTDGVRHSAKLAWRALALLQKEIETSVR